MYLYIYGTNTSDTATDIFQLRNGPLSIKWLVIWRGKFIDLLIIGVGVRVKTLACA